jgi:RNA polymerase sigma-70 factor, ECF subfamily
MEFNSANSSISEQSECVIGQCLNAMNEELLVSAAKSGDRIAFEELYVRHSSKILPRLCRITKNLEDAEDALQDAALRAFLHLKSFEGRSSFASWLTTIAVNSALMALRKRRRAEISIEQTSDDENSSRRWELPDHAESPEARYVRCEQETLLAEAIQRLPGIFREIVELQHSNEYSTMQLAGELGISLAAAKSRLMRARKTLQRFSSMRVNCGVKSKSISEPLRLRIRSTGAAVRG